MEKVAAFIVRFRWVFAAVVIVGAVVASVFISHVKINNDISKYIPNDSPSIIALDKMREEFGANGTVQVMVGDIGIGDIPALITELEKIDGVQSVNFDTANGYKDGNALLHVFFGSGDYGPATVKAVGGMRDYLKTTDYEISMSGVAIDMDYQSREIEKTMTVIMIIVCVIVFIILMLSSTSWIEPLVYVAVFGIAILINLGTNALFPHISFVTQAICAVMQLALALDYSIIFMHRFNEEKAAQPDVKTAVAKSLAVTISPVSASGLTTIAGLLALCFMKFTLGLDIGLVLAKGIVISLLTVFFFMPALIVLTAPLLEETKHRTLTEIWSGRKNAEKQRLGFSGFQFKTRIVVPVVLAALVIAGFVLQLNTKYSYTMAVAKKSTASVNVETNRITDVFGTQNSLGILVPKGDYTKEKELVEYLTQQFKIDGKLVISNAQGMAASGLYESVTADRIAAQFGLPLSAVAQMYAAMGGENAYPLYAVLSFASENQAAAALPDIQAQIDAYYAQAKSASALFESANYSRMIFNLDAAQSSNAEFDAVKSLRAKVSEFYSENYIVSGGATIYDVKESFTFDVITVGLISFFAVFLIILLMFKSVSIPIMLSTLIQGSIWITMGINSAVGSSVYFICYLVVLCIQMGATIDYAILLTGRYKEARVNHGRIESMRIAFHIALPTILTSGLILVIAALTVGFVSSVSIISSLGFLLAQGCAISLVLITFALPQVLLLCDKVMQKTSLGFKAKEDKTPRPS